MRSSVGRFQPKKMKALVRWQSVLLVTGTLLSAAKGLKLFGVLGPGEIMLVIFVLTVALDRQPMRDNDRVSAYGRGFAVFWYCLFVSLILGQFLRYGDLSYQVFPRSMVAYFLCATVGVAFLMSRLAKENLDLAIASLTAGIVLLAGLVAAAGLSGIESVAGISLYWRGTGRFQGWSTDPNQFAIVFIVGPFLVMHLVSAREVAHRKIREVIWAIGSLACLVFVQRLTDSDSLLVGWACGLASILLIKILRTKVVVPFIAGIGVTATLLVAYGQEIAERFSVASGEFFGKDSQGSTRLRLWSESIDIIARSPVFGFGADVGPINSAGVIVESHNNLLNFGMSAGMVGMISFLVLFGHSYALSLTSKRYWLSGGIVALFTFGLSHTTVRHPAYWVSLIVCAVIAYQTRTVTVPERAEGKAARFPGGGA